MVYSSVLSLFVLRPSSPFLLSFPLSLHPNPLSPSIFSIFFSLFLLPYFPFSFLSFSFLLSPMQCMVGVVPLGTGNDLARVLGWGSQCNDEEKIPALLTDMEKSSFKLLDRWSVQYTTEKDIDLSCLRSTSVSYGLGIGKRGEGVVPVVGEERGNGGRERER